ncbi:MAG: hypothetical protein LBS61_06080 [Endomicrobium sp.]|nr:hypothetical protein [Endomicrobium sp.]
MNFIGSYTTKKQQDIKTANKVIIKFENCYGINNLEYVFNFGNTKKSYAIYAQNGTMKTSFAKTLLDYSKGQTPDILPFPDITPKLSIMNGNNETINKGDIFVIKSEINNFNTEKTSTLSVNKELRKKHLEITKSIEEKKSSLIEKLQEISKIKNNKLNPNNLELTFTKDITGYPILRSFQYKYW